MPTITSATINFCDGWRSRKSCSKNPAMSKEPSPFVLHKRISIHTTSRCTAYKIYPKSMAPNPNDFTYLTKRANWIVVSSTLRQWAGRKKERERESHGLNLSSMLFQFMVSKNRGSPVTSKLWDLAELGKSRVWNSWGRIVCPWRKKKKTHCLILETWVSYLVASETGCWLC